MGGGCIFMYRRKRDAWLVDMDMDMDMDDDPSAYDGAWLCLVVPQRLEAAMEEARRAHELEVKVHPL
jgi:hypothetical protein